MKNITKVVGFGTDFTNESENRLSVIIGGDFENNRHNRLF